MNKLTNKLTNEEVSALRKDLKDSYEEMTKYHNIYSCNKCAGENEVEPVDMCESHISEAKTVCKDCGFTDYWAYGFFESSEDMESKCKTYSFDNEN